MNKRGSGILMHITSLPSVFGIGDLGPEAFAFVDFLKKAKQRYWQVLPLNPTNDVNCHSPYSSVSAFAGNDLMISPEFLCDEGLLSRSDIDDMAKKNTDRVDYAAVRALKESLFSTAYENFSDRNDKNDYAAFCRINSYWLDDYALFIVFKKHGNHAVWSDWPEVIRDRDSSALEALRREYHGCIEKEKFLQYIFSKQWHALKNYANKNGVSIIGDIPIYVTYDSVDVWTQPDLFKLTAEKKLAYLAGVPPDYFSKTGQLWGNPVYNWDALRQEGYAWWMRRIEHNMSLFDCVRIDHFRGFVDYWQVPAGQTTAMNGSWQKAPAQDFFQTLLARFPSLPIIAEDLGIITDEVRTFMHHFSFPGMKILLFAFGEDFPAHPYLPHNYHHNCVAYTGTHDNNTVKGWFKTEASEKDKERLYDYAGHKISAQQLHWEFIRIALSSVANTVITPIQDVLGLSEKSRMNIPGVASGNWQWRLMPGAVTDEMIEKLSAMTRRYNRAG
ncbi:MAG: 4-alpha-glucanotransferase [Candidatus Omnitrophica bacterium]|nr:4-alpha-glucanotransferase [Candidatus Omnitrophota bacterium]